jgi:hypothetical protein
VARPSGCRIETRLDARRLKATEFSSSEPAIRRWVSPVTTGFVDNADNYRWSSAGKRVETSLDAADTSVRATQASLIADQI